MSHLSIMALTERLTIKTWKWKIERFFRLRLTVVFGHAMFDLVR